jgi:SAM-dependent methyltransferase
MANSAGPVAYNAWYHTPRGRWIGECEFDLLLPLILPAHGASLLDVGCGTGDFSRRFAAVGLHVTGIDTDRVAIDFARQQDAGAVSYLGGSANALPFPDQVFDYAVAITSLCFIADPVGALRELWRVSQRSVVLGLLNRQSLLYRNKHGHGGYTSARWDTASNVRRWVAELECVPHISYGIFLPSGSRLSRLVERVMPHRIPWGGFLAVAVFRSH